MPLETASFISDLVSTNPAVPDGVNQGDDHLRLIKAVLKATLPNLNGVVTATPTQINSAVLTPSWVNIFPANPGATFSTSSIMLGLGAGGFSITPVRSGIVQVTISGLISTGTPGGGATYQIRCGTGAAPAGGAASSGSSVSQQVSLSPPSTAAVPFSIQGAVLFTPNIAAWLDLTLAMVGSGPAAVTSLTCTAVEL